MRIRVAVPDRFITPSILNPMLEAVTRANAAMMQAGAVPPISDAIRRGAVRWKPEPKGQGEHFDLASVVLGRGWGDCDDLAPGYAGELRAMGIDPNARAAVVRSGPKRWHAITVRGDGRIEDPSKAAGMRRGGRGVAGAAERMLAPPGRGALALRPWGRGYAARCDVPWSGGAICGHHSARHWLDAISGAVEGACVVGEYAGSNPDARARALALESMFHGEHPDDIRHALHAAGYSHVIGQFGDLLAEHQPDTSVGFLPLAAALAPSVLPMAQGLLSKIMPGAGGAPAAAPAAAPAGAPSVSMPTGGGGTPGGAILPIIVKF